MLLAYPEMDDFIFLTIEAPLIIIIKKKKSEEYVWESNARTKKKKGKILRWQQTVPELHEVENKRGQCKKHLNYLIFSWAFFQSVRKQQVGMITKSRPFSFRKHEEEENISTVPKEMKGT